MQGPNPDVTVEVSSAELKMMDESRKTSNRDITGDAGGTGNLVGGVR